MLFDFFKNRKITIYDRTGKIPYLVRWYIFLKDRKSFPFNITLHKVLVSDEPVLHDHPWSWGAFIIKVGYIQFDNSVNTSLNTLKTSLKKENTFI